MNQRLKTALLATLSLCLFSACSSEKANPPLNRIFTDIVRDKIKKKEQGQQAVAQITRAQVEAGKLPLLRAHLEKFDVRATLVEVARNGEHRTYFTGDEISITLRNDILISTRGLGLDLAALGLSSGDLQTALAKKEMQRGYRYIDVQNKQQNVVVSCTVMVSGPATELDLLDVKHNVVPITEHCEGDGITFENEYWMNPNSGNIWKSTQWIGVGIGRITIEVLKRDPSL